MPIYEYTCKQCGQKFEQIISSSNTDKEVCCSNCQSTEVEKVISAPAGLNIAGSSDSGCSPNSRFS